MNWKKKIGFCLAVWLLVHATGGLADLLPDALEDDVLRRDATQALLNYQARLAEAERRHNLSIPPGTDDAIKTGTFMALMQPKVENIGIKYIEDEFFEALFEPRSKKKYFEDYHKNLLKSDKPDINVLRFLKTRQLDVKEAGYQAQLIRNIVQPFTDDSKVMSEGLRDKLKTLELRDKATGATPYRISDFEKADGNGLTADEKNELIRFVVSQTSYSAAYASLYELLAKRVVDKDAPDHKSLLETMHVESTRRVESPDWYQEIAVMPRDSLLREIAHIEAFQLWMQYQQYRQQELAQFMMASLMSQVQRATSSMETYVETSQAAATTNSIADNPS